MDYLVVGAYKTDVLPSTKTGSAYVYWRDATGDFVYWDRLHPSSTSNAHCGWQVAIDGPVLVVGCYGSDSLAGEVAFYERNPASGASGQPYGAQWDLVATRDAAPPPPPLPPVLTGHASSLLLY